MLTLSLAPQAPPRSLRLDPLALSGAAQACQNRVAVGLPRFMALTRGRWLTTTPLCIIGSEIS